MCAYLCWFLTLLSASSAQASVFELQVRENITDGFNLPALSVFDPSTPLLDEAGQVAVAVLVVGGSGASSLWYGGHGQGSLVYQMPDAETFFSSLSVHSSGQIIFNQLLENGVADGIFIFDPSSHTTQKLLGIGGPFGSISFAAVRLLGTPGNQLGFRSIDNRGNHTVALQSLLATPPSLNLPPPIRIASEKANDPSSPFQYLFSPEMNEAGKIVGKALDARGADIVTEWFLDGTSRTLPLIGQPAGPGLPHIIGIDNSLALSSDGQLAFVGRLEGGARGVYLWDGLAVKEIAHNRIGSALHEIEFFPPAVNRHGWVAFRAKDAAGLEAIYAGNGQVLKRVIAQHDLIPSDLGMARAQQDNEHDPVFSGGIALNDHDQLVFRAALTPANDNRTEWGEGVYLTTLELPLPDIQPSGPPR